MSPGRALVEGLGQSIPLQMYRSLLRRRVLGAYYHIASDQNLPHVRHLHGYKSSELFERDLVYLKHNFCLISYRQLAESAEGGPPLPANPLFLSVDDGYAECFSVMRPILLRHGIPCTFFVTTGHLDNKRIYYKNAVSLCVDKFRQLNARGQVRVIHDVNTLIGRSIDTSSNFELWLSLLSYQDTRMIDMVCAILGVDVNRFLEDTQPYMTTDQVRQLSRDGFQIGAHGRNHQRLDRLTEQQVREEIIGSCSDVRAITNQDTVPFAFPHSSGSLDRVFLTILASEFRFIGMMLDSNGVAKDAPRILHRVCLDSRDSGLHRHSNAARHFRDAFQRQAATNISRLGRTLSRR